MNEAMKRNMTLAELERYGVILRLGDLHGYLVEDWRRKEAEKAEDAKEDKWHEGYADGYDDAMNSVREFTRNGR